MSPTDLTIEILTSIRDEIRTTRADLSERIDTTNTRIDTTNARLETMGTALSERIDRVERRQVETEMRLATEIVAVAGAINGLRDDLRQDRALRQRVDEHERRLGAIEHRIG